MKFFLLLALPAFLSSALLFFFLTQNKGGGVPGTPCPSLRSDSVLNP